MKFGSVIRNLALVAAVACGSAQAAPVTGGVSFGGAWLPTGGTGISDSTGVDVIGNIVNINCALTSTCEGSYATVSGVGLTAVYNDFSFLPSLGGSTTPLWTFDFGGNTYSFDLLTVSIDERDSNSLVLSGTGTLKITGFDDTPGAWTFSGDSTGVVFAFSSTASAIPEPGSLALLGLSLAGLALVRRRRS